MEISLVKWGSVHADFFFHCRGREGYVTDFVHLASACGKLGEAAKHRCMCVCDIFYREHPSVHYLPNEGMGGLLKFQNKRQSTENGGPLLVVQCVKNPPSNAGDRGSIPSQGTKLSRAEMQLRLDTAGKRQQKAEN